VLVFFFDYAVTGAGGTPVTGLLITWYLYRNVRRLAAEAERNREA